MTNLEKLASSVVFIKKAENDSDVGNSTDIGRFFTPTLISQSNKSSLKGLLGELLNTLTPLGLGKATYYGFKKPTEEDFRKQLDFFKDKGYLESALSTSKTPMQIGAGLGGLGSLPGVISTMKHGFKANPYNRENLLIRLLQGAGLLGASTLAGGAALGIPTAAPGLWGKFVDKNLVTSEDKDRVAKTLAKSPFLTGTTTGLTDLLTAATS